MRYILIPLLASVLSFPAFATNSCPDQAHVIAQNEAEIRAIHIPSITYTVNTENCSKVEPTLLAIEEIVPKLSKLQGQFENYYQTCDRSMDVIYAIEETKINIILMATLKDLAENLAVQCESN